MSGGVAYVLDVDGLFAKRCNLSMVTLEKVESADKPAQVQHLGQPDEAILRGLIEKHVAYTGSEYAQELLQNWTTTRGKFVKVMPNEYKRALAEMAIAAQKQAA
jgi:glutamate synthase (NADPH/NADH) large chain